MIGNEAINNVDMKEVTYTDAASAKKKKSIKLKRFRAFTGTESEREKYNAKVMRAKDFICLFFLFFCAGNKSLSLKSARSPRGRSMTSTWT